jgi:hypothetical protein
MFKSKFIALVLGMVLLLLSVSCAAIPQSVPESQEVQLVTTIIKEEKTEEATTVDNSKISKKLAQLVGNAGKGNRLHLGMSEEEIEKVLIEENIPYTADRFKTEFVDDTTFIIDDGAMLSDGYFSLSETKEGLKIGDSRERAEEIYGKEYFTDKNKTYYSYLTGGVHSLHGTKIQLSISFMSDKVYGMEYRTRQDYEEEAQKN